MRRSVISFIFKTSGNSMSFFFCFEIRFLLPHLGNHGGGGRVPNAVAGYDSRGGGGFP